MVARGLLCLQGHLTQAHCKGLLSEEDGGEERGNGEQGRKRREQAVDGNRGGRKRRREEVVRGWQGQEMEEVEGSRDRNREQ